MFLLCSFSPVSVSCLPLLLSTPPLCAPKLTREGYYSDESSHKRIKVFNKAKKTAQSFGFQKEKKLFRFHAAFASAPPCAAQDSIAPSIVPNTSSTFPAPSTLTITSS